MVHLHPHDEQDCRLYQADSCFSLQLQVPATAAVLQVRIPQLDAKAACLLHTCCMELKRGAGLSFKLWDAHLQHSRNRRGRSGCVTSFQRLAWLALEVVAGPRAAHGGGTMADTQQYPDWSIPRCITCCDSSAPVRLCCHSHKHGLVCAACAQLCTCCCGAIEQL